MVEFRHKYVFYAVYGVIILFMVIITCGCESGGDACFCFVTASETKPSPDVCSELGLL